METRESNNTMAKVIFLALLFISLSLPPSTHSIIISYTLAGLPCITECIPWVSPDHGPMHYCYSKWNEWNYCTPGFIPALDYFTSHSNDYAHEASRNNGNCTSLCGIFGDAGGKSWCYTNGWNGQDGRGPATWDYCSMGPGQNVLGEQCVGACERYAIEYLCGLGYENSLQPCSPAPSQNKFVDFENRYLKTNWGVLVSFLNFISLGTFKDQVCAVPNEGRALEPIRATRQGGIDPDEEARIRHLGVRAMSAIYSIMYPNLLTGVELNPPGTNAAANPITQVRYEEAPQGIGLPPIRLVRSMHAVITRNHLRVGPRGDMPPNSWNRMRDLQYIRGVDERGHLVADSMGGPNLWYNFAPQTNVVNRNFGFGGQRVDGSWWYRAEGEIRNFFQDPRADHVDWELIITYNDTMVSRRPTGFGLQYTTFYANNILPGVPSGDMVFNNDRDPLAANSVC